MQELRYISIMGAEFMNQDVGFKISSKRFKVSGLKHRVKGSGLRTKGLRFKVVGTKGSGF